MSSSRYANPTAEPILLQVYHYPPARSRRRLKSRRKTRFIISWRFRNKRIQITYTYLSSGFYNSNLNIWLICYILRKESDATPATTLTSSSIFRYGEAATTRWRLKKKILNQIFTIKEGVSLIYIYYFNWQKYKKREFQSSNEGEKKRFWDRNLKISVIISFAFSFYFLPTTIKSLGFFL